MSQPKYFKVHTDNRGRLIACIEHAMYGVSKTAIREQMPIELLNIREGDIVFISAREILNNVLVGPFYVVKKRPPIVINSRKGLWGEVDLNNTPHNCIAYWVIIENRKWCLLFDKTLSDKISIVWPYNWSTLKLDLPSWGEITGIDADKLLEFAINNELEAKELFRRHGINMPK
jgi:hypothetical protein